MMLLYLVIKDAEQRARGEPGCLGGPTLGDLVDMTAFDWFQGLFFTVFFLGSIAILCYGCSLI